ncbi:MAG: hypothetical protein K6F33_14745 [Bacteroidales bacterium]|nr:hypothetical protein [Bacteroidales bacterium]
MKYVFNVALAFVVIWVVWSVIDHEPKTENIHVSHVKADTSFVGARSLKVCRNSFQMPMGVVFCNDEMFVSNVVVNPDEDDTLGYVCRAGLYGDIVDSLKIPALYAPKGMVEQDGYLYIADISRVVKYNLDKDELVSIIYVPNAKSLFGLAKDRLQRIYVTDTESKTVYRIEGDSARVFANDTLLAGVSGLCSYNGYLYAAAHRRIVRIDSMGRTKIFAHTAYPVCGISSDDEGNFITTDYAGNIYVVSSGKQQLLVKKRNNVSGADINYIPEQRRLVVPTGTGNSVEIYEMGKYLQQ